MNVYINCIGEDEDRPYQGGLIAVAANSIEECIKIVSTSDRWKGYYDDFYLDRETGEWKKCLPDSEQFRNDNWKLQENLIANVDIPQILFVDIYVE